MAIYSILHEAGFSPEDFNRMTVAYESALRLLRLDDRHDPVTELIAKKIIEVRRSGEYDPAHICARAIKELGIPIPDDGII